MFQNELLRIIQKYRYVPHVEIELRFGWNHQMLTKFDTNIQERYFTPLLKILQQSFTHSNTFHSHLCSHTTVLTDSTKRLRLIRDTNTQKTLSMHSKHKLEMVDCQLEGTPFDVRICASIEKPVTNNIEQWFPIRTRVRNTYRYKMWNYDLTESVYAEPVNDTIRTYEFEIELDCDFVNTNKINSLYLAESLWMKIKDIVTMSLVDDEIIHLKNCNLLSNNKYTLNHGSHSLQKL